MSTAEVYFPEDIANMIANARADERDAAQARHDAEIAGIVADLRERARDGKKYANTRLGQALRANLDGLAYRYETMHAAALARHAGRNNTNGGSDAD